VEVDPTTCRKIVFENRTPDNETLVPSSWNLNQTNRVAHPEFYWLATDTKYVINYYVRSYIDVLTSRTE
jgi:hypothetical protein